MKNRYMSLLPGICQGVTREVPEKRDGFTGYVSRFWFRWVPGAVGFLLSLGMFCRG